MILNTAKASFGDSSPYLQANAAIPVLGTARIGDTVFRDDGAGTPANANNGVQNAGETVLANVGLTLYWDRDGDGVLDAGEPARRHHHAAAPPAAAAAAPATTASPASPPATSWWWSTRTTPTCRRASASPRRRPRCPRT